MTKAMFMSAPAPKGFTLGERWQSRVAKAYAEKWQKPLTQEERGQLKMLANVLGARTDEVITYAIKNWNRFASMAAAEAGVSSFPTEPRIGFLLAHCQTAVNLIREEAAKAVKEAELAKWRAEMADAQEKAWREREREQREETPYRPSRYEVFALLKEFEQK